MEVFRFLITVDISHVSRTIVSLIYFSIVEFHQADWVMQQFEFQKTIPTSPLNLDQHQKEDMRGRINRY